MRRILATSQELEQGQEEMRRADARMNVRHWKEVRRLWKIGLLVKVKSRLRVRKKL